MEIKSFLIVLFAAFVCFAQERSFNSNDFNQEKLNDLTMYSTAENTDLRLTKVLQAKFKDGSQPLESEISVFVNPNKVFQEFIGIGGAATDASAEVFAKLPADKQKEFMKAYFSKEEGIGYSLLRTNIHSCDFSSNSYTYIDEGDGDLKTFSIDHDKQYRIPFIKQAIKSAGGFILLYASPWSPPAFMKDNNTMLQGGKLLPKYHQTWADYFVKFINSYEAEGIPIWGVTVQNEPMAKQRWESCMYTAEEERDFLKNFLGPTFVKAGLADKNIIVWDHNRDLINQRANTILSDPEAAKYAWGVGFHWYETWATGQPMFENVGNVYESFPDKKLLFTEGCVEKFDWEKLQYWPNAERYGRSMINDFNNGTVGWTDWNILLDETGGPNHKNNLCFAPIHANLKTGELIYTPSYYYIGHFSKFIRPNARRLSTASSRSQLLSTSFKNEDGSFVTVLMNQSDDKIKCNLFVGSKVCELEILPHSMNSVIY
ncbi:MAG: glycoside hydrolase family 30 protein [Ignavibacteriaceae bacterium]|nr:glycoside hydrolase family 30 protein [Ignavibacteriaceae bacterium]